MWDLMPTTPCPWHPCYGIDTVLSVYRLLWNYDFSLGWVSSSRVFLLYTAISKEYIVIHEKAARSSMSSSLPQIPQKYVSDVAVLYCDRISVTLQFFTWCHGSHYIFYRRTLECLTLVFFSWCTVIMWCALCSENVCVGEEGSHNNLLWKEII